ncbi:MAG: hypothetical protein ABSF44_15645 [Candidatus Bathyarchaeia archaeon]
MQELQGKLASFGFRQNRKNNWSNGHSKVQIVTSSEFSQNAVRVSWKEEWKEYLAIIFDYSTAQGPVCIVPTTLFFTSQFVSKNAR